MSRQPCTQTGFAADRIGENCPFCRHTNIVHSVRGHSQTAGGECQLCVLEIKLEQLDELIEKYQDLMGQALGHNEKPT